MKKVKIKLFNSEVSRELQVLVFNTKKDFIEVAEVIDQKKIPYLFPIPTEYIVTLLELSNVIPYEIWYFDEDFKFYAKGFSLFSGKGNFRIQTPARYLLFWHRESEVFKSFKGFSSTKLMLDFNKKID